MGNKLSSPAAARTDRPPPSPAEPTQPSHRSAVGDYDPTLGEFLPKRRQRSSRGVALTPSCRHESRQSWRLRSTAMARPLGARRSLVHHPSMATANVTALRFESGRGQPLQSLASQSEGWVAEEAARQGACIGRVPATQKTRWPAANVSFAPAAQDIATPMWCGGATKLLALWRNELTARSSIPTTPGIPEPRPDGGAPWRRAKASHDSCGYVSPGGPENRRRDGH